MSAMSAVSPRRYWLMKSEPGDYSIADLARDGSDLWTGVRNFQARNFLREARPGDGVLFYHSSCAAPGVYGVAEVCEEASPDPTQFARGKYRDPRATKEKPLWFCPRVRFVRELRTPWLLARIRREPALAGMTLLRRGNRLSVMPATLAEWRILSAEPPPSADAGAE